MSSRVYEDSLALPERVARLVESLALRLAETQQGRITAHHLMPYLPLSLALLSQFLDRIADHREVFTTSGEHGVVYEFAAYREAPARPGILQVSACIDCGTDLPAARLGILCPGCMGTLHAELRQLVCPSDWLALATAEHALLYTATRHAGPLSATTLTRHTRTTLRQTQQHLQRLHLDGYLYQDVDLQTGVLIYTFPVMVYPQALYQQNLRALQALHTPPPSWWGGSARRSLLLLGGLALGLALYVSCSTFFPSRHRPEPPTPLPPQSQATARQRAAIRVSIGKDGFAPATGMKVSATQHPPLRLSDRRPEGIVKEPAYQGEQQKYGVLRLGTRTPNTYPFVLDLLPGVSPVLYVDINQNGNLADDGEPLSNQGSGFFATTIKLPLVHLWHEVRLPGTYDVWFFTNNGLWKNGLVTYYSRTQLKGSVPIAGRRYTAYLADRSANDADFTNDGIHIDLDGDGKINASTESFPPGSLVYIDNHAYAFEVTW